MFRRMFVATLAAALLLIPASALAQTAEDPAPTSEETPSPLDVLAALLDGIVVTFGIDLTATPPVDGSVLEDEALAEDLARARAALADVVDALAIEFHVRATLEDLEPEGEDVAEADDAEPDAAEDNHGQIVRTVAHCTPRGKAAIGWLAGVENHGQFVSTVARGGTVGVYVPTIVTDAETGDHTVTAAEAPTEFGFASLADAETFCDAMATIQLAKDLQAGLEGEQLTDKELRKAERDARKAERKAERDARKAERRAQRDARKAGRG